MRYHLVTLGCPKNTVDSEHIERELAARGHVPTVRPSDADLLIVNTCGFIDAAKEESVDAVVRLATRKHEGQRLVVAGCLTQLHGDELAREVPEIDRWFGVEQWDAIARYTGGAPYDIPETRPVGGRRVSAYLKISDGCDAPCTFCIIPRIKGRFRSASLGSLTAEARRLAAEGARELVLVAQDSTAWGEDLGLRDGLAGLLRELAAAVPELPWIRVMYAYPGRVTPRLIAAMAETPQVVHYLDMPLQHGSETALRRMRRPQRMDRVLAQVEALRAAMPDIALRTSLIVGFPGETEAELDELLQLVRRVRFDHVGVFTYSPQEGTPAAALPGQLPEGEKRRRRDVVMRLQQEIALEKRRALVGTVQQVLIESEPPAPGAGATVAGRTYRDAPEVDGLVLAHGQAEAGTFAHVRITDAGPYDLVGQLSEEA